jgi:hypothetical protein
VRGEAQQFWARLPTWPSWDPSWRFHETLFTAQG